MGRWWLDSLPPCIVAIRLDCFVDWRVPFACSWLVWPRCSHMFRNCFGLAWLSVLTGTFAAPVSCRILYENTSGFAMMRIAFVDGDCKFAGGGSTLAWMWLVVFACSGVFMSWGYFAIPPELHREKSWVWRSSTPLGWGCISKRFNSHKCWRGM